MGIQLSGWGNVPLAAESAGYSMWVECLRKMIYSQFYIA
jgi:hypothetical protein